MKVIILALFASLAIGGAFGDEKATAIEEIDMKYKEIFVYAHTVVKHIEDEIRKTDPGAVSEAKEYGQNLKSNYLKQFADEVKKVSRTAVVRGKPLSTFDCLANVAMEGRAQILQHYEDLVKKIDGVVGVRGSRLEMTMITAGLVLDSVTELKNQAVNAIKEADSGIKSLKDEALKRIETGKKLFNNLESSSQKPTLKEEYVALKQNSEAKFKEIRDALFRRLQKCL